MGVDHEIAVIMPYQSEKQTDESPDRTASADKLVHRLRGYPLSVDLRRVLPTARKPCV